MLICLPGLKSKANITNLLFYSTRQPYKGHPSIPLLPYCIFYKCTGQICGSHPQKDQGGVIALSPVTPVAQCHCAGALQLAQEGKTHLSSLAGCPLSPVLRSY